MIIYALTDGDIGLYVLYFIWNVCMYAREGYSHNVREDRSPKAKAGMGRISGFCFILDFLGWFISGVGAQG